jgi:hypothetical protein
VATDGEISQDAILGLVIANPAGLYRMVLVTTLSGSDALSELGLVSTLPGPSTIAAITTAWIVGPVGISALVLSNGRAFR